MTQECLSTTATRESLLRCPVIIVAAWSTVRVAGFEQASTLDIFFVGHQDFFEGVMTVTAPQPLHHRSDQRFDQDLASHVHWGCFNNAA